jgi:hypothetical protein
MHRPATSDLTLASALNGRSHPILIPEPRTSGRGAWVVAGSGGCGVATINLSPFNARSTMWLVAIAMPASGD